MRRLLERRPLATISGSEPPENATTKRPRARIALPDLNMHVITTRGDELERPQALWLEKQTQIETSRFPDDFSSAPPDVVVGVEDDGGALDLFFGGHLLQA
jgi:hypothetical protein